MKPRSIVFLQVVIVLIAVAALLFLVRAPLTEGRAKNLDLPAIYLDPLILFGYVSSIAFFVALYKTFILLGYIKQNEMFSAKPVKALRSIRQCAIILGILIVLAATYIRLFHAKEDDPAGVLALSIIAVFITVVVATAAAVFEHILKTGTAIKTENEQLQQQLKK